MAFLCRIREKLRILLVGLLLVQLAGCAGLVPRAMVPPATAEAERRLLQRQLDCWQQQEMPRSVLPGAQAQALRAITSSAPP